MKKELERLLKMRKENKISEGDFNMLSGALTKNSFCSTLENSLLINPFQKIAGLKALSIGIILMLVMSAIGVYANIYIDGSIGYFTTSNLLKISRAPSFLLLLYQNIVACLSLAILFYLAARLLHQKGIRFIDFLGTVTFARYPTCISLMFFILEKWLRPEAFNDDLSKGLHFSIIGSLSALLWTACYIWQGMNYFFALKESSGLDGKRLWSAFLITMTVGDILAIILTRFFLYS